MQIGRVTDIREPLSVEQEGLSTVGFELLVSEVQARQLLDLAGNTAERFVPVVSTSMPELDGLYELDGVSAAADPDVKHAGLRRLVVSARAQNRGRQVANAVLAVRGDNRWVNSWNGTSYPAGGAGCTGPLYRVAVPDGATSIQSFNAGAAGFSVEGSAVSTMRGAVRRLVDNTQVKDSVLVATTANITLSGTQTVDGVSVSTTGTRVLVKNQTTASQNGIYERQSGAWTRAADADSGTELDFAQVGVTIGTVNGGSSWFLPQAVTIGTTAQSWRRAPSFGLRESDRRGPVSVSYQAALSTWYNGACTITQGSNVVTGLRLASSGTVTMDNGLIRVEYGTRTVSSVDYNGLKFKMASGSPLAYGAEEYFIVPVGTGLTILDLDPPSVVTNTADQTVLRYRFTGGVLDVAMTRGCRTLTLAVSTPQPAPFLFFVADSLNNGVFNLATATPANGFVDTTATMSAAGTDYEALMYADTNDTDGNRLGLTANTFSTFPAVSNLVGLHAVVGGGSTLTGDDQLFGLAREWFAALATQTSAGVL